MNETFVPQPQALGREETYICRPPESGDFSACESFMDQIDRSEGAGQPRLPAFGGLRIMPWEPSFHWEPTLESCANRINFPHEDYPERIPQTINAYHWLSQELNRDCRLTTEQLLRVNGMIFGDKPFGGKLRWVNVIVAEHKPPEHGMLPKLMRELEETYRDRLTNIVNLKAWYDDFETIHPFQDGNGRTGGVVLAAYSHRWRPEQGFLSPGQ